MTNVYYALILILAGTVAFVLGVNVGYHEASEDFKDMIYIIQDKIDAIDGQNDENEQNGWMNK